MGAIVLQNSTTSDKHFTIIDGQQRLATLSIIAIAVIEGIKKLVDTDKDKEANRERQEILRRTYLGDKDPRSLRYSSKILLNENNNDFYQSHLINLRKPRNVRILPKSNQLLWNAFEYFTRELEKFSREDFTRLLRLISVISFRYHVVSSLNPNELETIYNKMAVAISQNKITNPRQVFEKVRSIYVSDDKFSQDFSIMSISTKGQKKKLVKYILCKLESHISGLEINEDSFSIEHILHESPSNQWQEYFNDNQIEEMVYRLGNMTLLEPNFNREIGNRNYTLKREIYQQSNYQLTKNIQAEEWNPDSLHRRQIQLAKKATQIWRSSFL